MTLLSRLARAKKSRRETWDDLSIAAGQNSRQALVSKISKQTLEEDLQMIRRLACALKVAPCWLAFGHKERRPATLTGSISETLRHAIQQASTSRYSLAKQAGVTESSLSRFVSGRQNLSLDGVDRVAQVLGFELVKRKDGSR